MTRRELRAMQQQAEAAAAAADLVEPPEASASASALSAAIAEFEALTRATAGHTGAIPVAPPVPVTESFSQPDPFAGLGAAPTASQRVELPPPAEDAAPVWQIPAEDTNDWNTVEAPAAALPEIVEVADAAEPAPFPFTLQSSTAAEAAAPQTDETPIWARETQPWSAVADRASDEMISDDDVDEDPVGETEAHFVEPQVVRESYTPPVGHWSRQAELDDELPIETTLSREVGGSNLSTTTSALILPSIPQSDFSGLINGTGEILITGTIELPSSLGSMGADARHFDNPDVDHMFDAFDKELVSNDSQPVRAIRAVSTHTASRGVIQINTKPQGNRLTTVAIVAACVLAASAVGLLAFFIINNLG
jgi:hypothetical protein